VVIKKAERATLTVTILTERCKGTFFRKQNTVSCLKIFFFTEAFARKCHAAYVIPAQAGIQTEDFHINSLASRFRGNDGILLFGESLTPMDQHFRDATPGNSNH
jgi:hypothetical protein